MYKVCSSHHELLNHFISPEFGNCPGNQLDGYITDGLIYPEYDVHSLCGHRSKTGEYTINKRLNFTTPSMCGFKQVTFFFSLFNFL